MGFGLYLTSQRDELYIAFVNFDSSCNQNMYQSILGIICKFNDLTIHWSNKVQDIVSLSITKAKYWILLYATSTILYLQKIFTKTKMSKIYPTSLFSNNQSCMYLVDNPILHKKTKHINIRIHFIKKSYDKKSKDRLYSYNHLISRFYY